MYNNAKYELTDTNERPLGPNVRLFRLKALRDIGSDVKAGDLGGLIGGPGTLSEHGECWVHPDAIVYGGATVWDNAQVHDQARVLGPVQLEGDCLVGGTAQILANLRVNGSAYLEDVQVVSLMVKAAGQCTYSGATWFYFDCLLNDRDNTVRLEIPSSHCTPEAAAAFALTTAGTRLSYLKYKGNIYPLGQGQHEELSIPPLEQLLDAIDNGTYGRPHALDYVLHVN